MAILQNEIDCARLVEAVTSGQVQAHIGV